MEVEEPLHRHHAAALAEALAEAPVAEHHLEARHLHHAAAAAEAAAAAVVAVAAVAAAAAEEAVVEHHLQPAVVIGDALV